VAGEVLAALEAHKRRMALPRRGESRQIPFSEFRQVVRRYRPSELLPALSAIAAARSQEFTAPGDLIGAPPWAIANAARESILWGNEHRRAGVTADAVIGILNAHNSIEEDLTADSLRDFFVRTAYQQFPYQESTFEEVARTHALLIEGCSEIPTEALSPPELDMLLGAPVGQVVGATFFLHVAATLHGGRLDPTWFDHPDLDPLYEAWPRSVIEMRAADLTSDFDQFKRDYHRQKSPPPGFERYAYNPLFRRPFVRMPDGQVLCPQPRLIMRTVTPGALYYAGTEALGEAFTRDLGILTQHYVGKQLRSIDPSIVVHPEINYRVGRETLASTDWFLDLPGVLVLVEVKSFQFNLLERSGFGEYETRVGSLMDKAIGQLERSSQAIDDGLPEFTHLDPNKPRIGLIVTREPHYLGNSSWFRDLATVSVSFPTLVASLRDIEHLCRLALRDVEEELVRISGDAELSTWNLGSALSSDLPRRENIILSRAWNSYPWPTDPDS
jgi:hypothetical protein